MSSFHRFVSKVLTTIGIKKNRQNIPQLPMPKKRTVSTPERYNFFVRDYYKQRGYTVWEYSKEKALKENHINLVIKQNQDILLINSRNSEKDIRIEEIHSFEKEANEFLKKNQIFESYSIKLIYNIPSLLLEESSFKYIETNSHINYRILKETN